MNNVNKTLYIPLYGKAYVSRRGIILRDEKAEQIWAAEGFDLKGKSKSKRLACYMGMRSAVFDNWLRQRMAEAPEAVVLHLGCGLDSRVERVGCGAQLWFDLDFPEVIDERRRYYRETEHYRMISADVRDSGWLDSVTGGSAIVVMEGVSMYLRPEELRKTLAAIRERFEKVRLLMDCYTEFAARASRVKNPINDVGVTQVYGLDDPKLVEKDTGLRFIREYEMTPENLIGELPDAEQWIFRKLFAGGIAKKLYRLYEYG